MNESNRLDVADDAPDPISEGEFRERFLGALGPAVAAFGGMVDADAAEAAVVFCRKVRVVNRYLNLTRIVEPEEMAVKHVADSWSVLAAMPAWRDGGRIADIGTGAGFPGLPLKWAAPAIDLVLVDSLRKRLGFLEQSAGVGFTGIHARAEDLGRDPLGREAFDGVVARALAPLPVLLEWCGPLVAVGGSFVAMLGSTIAEEGRPDALGLKLVRERQWWLPDGDEPALRRLRVYEKIRPTLPRYPRRPAEIKSKPLA